MYLSYLIFRIIAENPNNLEMDEIIDALVTYNKRSVLLNTSFYTEISPSPVNHFVWSGNLYMIAVISLLHIVHHLWKQIFWKMNQVLIHLVYFFCIHFFDIDRCIHLIFYSLVRNKRNTLKIHVCFQ